MKGMPTGDLVAAYEETVARCAGVEAVDAALVEAGRAIAVQVQDTIDTGSGQDITKSLYLLPHLMAVLRELGASPAARDALTGGNKGASGGKLADFRSATGNKVA